EPRSTIGAGFGLNLNRLRSWPPGDGRLADSDSRWTSGVPGPAVPEACAPAPRGPDGPPAAGTAARGHCRYAATATATASTPIRIFWRRSGRIAVLPEVGREVDRHGQRVVSGAFRQRDIVDDD